MKAMQTLRLDVDVDALDSTASVEALERAAAILRSGGTVAGAHGDGVRPGGQRARCQCGRSDF